MRQVKRVFVVDDEEALRRSCTRVLTKAGFTVESAGTKTEALAAIEHGAFDLVIVDVILPDGSGVDIVRIASRLRPAPLILVMSGLASRQETFIAAQEGAVAFLEKPFDGQQLLGLIERVSSRAPFELAPLVTALVGHEGLRDVVDRVRADMASQALAMAAGNNSDAAKLLGVSRQAVQQLKKRDDEATDNDDDG